jgi:hypothetical protein
MSIFEGVFLGPRPEAVPLAAIACRLYDKLPVEERDPPCRLIWHMPSKSPPMFANQPYGGGLLDS